MLNAIHSTTGSEYDIKEDFSATPDTVYQEITEFIKKRISSGDVRKVTVLDLKEKIRLAKQIKAHVGVPTWQIGKYLHL